MIHGCWLLKGAVCGVTYLASVSKCSVLQIVCVIIVQGGSRTRVSRLLYMQRQWPMSQLQIVIVRTTPLTSLEKSDVAVCQLVQSQSFVVNLAFPPRNFPCLATMILVVRRCPKSHRIRVTSGPPLDCGRMRSNPLLLYFS